MISHKILVTRDVTFYERHFPFHILSTAISDPDPIFTPSATYDCFDDTFPIYSSTPPLQSANQPPSSPPLILSPDTSFSPPSSPDPTSPPNSPSASLPTSHDPTQTQDLVDLSTLSQPAPPSPPLRQSTRLHKPPAYLSQYHCNTSSAAITNHWCNLVSFSSFPSSYKTFLATSSETLQEPSNYTEASSKPEWIEAMNKEIQALVTNNTWDLVDLPSGKKPIGNKWVYKIKLEADGTLDRCKARLVTKGFNQKYGIDYEETFSPVVKMPTIRCILAIASYNKWPVYQLDVNNAFLHGDLKEEVYMKVPLGFPNPHNKVCKLNKSLYGLKQASRQWFARLVEELTTQGFLQSKNDYSLFIKRADSDITVAAVYVDDIVLTGTNIHAINSLKQHLHQIFSIKDLGILHYFLGIEVAYLPEGVLMSQHKFSKELLTDCNLDLSKKAYTPLQFMSNYKLKRVIYFLILNFIGLLWANLTFLLTLDLICPLLSKV